jgi:hypothetical protein
MFNPVYDKMKSKPEEFYGDSAYDTYEVNWRRMELRQHTCKP